MNLYRTDRVLVTDGVLVPLPYFFFVKIFGKAENGRSASAFEFGEELIIFRRVHK